MAIHRKIHEKIILLSSFIQSPSFFFLGTHFIKLPSLAGRFPQGRATSKNIMLSGYSSGIELSLFYRTRPVSFCSISCIWPIRIRIASR